MTAAETLAHVGRHRPGVLLATMRAGDHRDEKGLRGLSVSICGHRSRSIPDAAQLAPGLLRILPTTADTQHGHDRGDDDVRLAGTSTEYAQRCQYDGGVTEGVIARADAHRAHVASPVRRR